MAKARHPINSVKWRTRTDLDPNDYNPNAVPARELDLLATSILTDGWTQPIVITPTDIIIDGFHRWTIAARPDIAALTDGQVPTVILNTENPEAHRLATIRHNRARGEHQIGAMSRLVSAMKTEGTTSARLQREMGLEEEEVLRLTSSIETVAETYADHAPTELEI